MAMYDDDDFTYDPSWSAQVGAGRRGGHFASPAAPAVAPEPTPAPAARPQARPVAEKPRKKRSVLGIIWGVFSTLVVIVLAALAIALAGVRLVGFTPYAVLSGSMQPAYMVGDLIYVKACDPLDVQVGDAITFRIGNEKVATHRVVEVDREGQAFRTKGDANEAVDGAPIAYQDLVGKVAFSIPKLGYLSSYVTSEQGRYIAIAAVAVLIFLLLLPGVFGKDDDDEDDDDEPQAAPMVHGSHARR